MIPQINIAQTLGQIGIRYQPEQWNVVSPPDQLTIHNATTDLNIDTTPPNLSIDQTQAFADEGLRTPLAFSQYEASKARQTAENGTASAADWGHRFLHIEKGNALNPYVSRYEDKQVQLTPALVPGPFSVKVSYQPGTVHIHADVTPVKIQADIQPVQVTVSPGKANIYLAQAPQLHISAPAVGQLVDAMA